MIEWVNGMINVNEWMNELINEWWKFAFQSSCLCYDLSMTDRNTAVTVKDRSLVLIHHYRDINLHQYQVTKELISQIFRHQ